MSHSPIIDISLSDNESENSYIMVSTNSHDSMHEWDECDEMRHERDVIDEIKHTDGDGDGDEEIHDEIQQHQHDKKNDHVVDQLQVRHQHDKENKDQNEDVHVVSQDKEPQQIPSPCIGEWHQPHYQHDKEQIQPLDHTIDIPADTSDSDDDVEEQHTISDSICVCRIHYDDDESSITSTPEIQERILSIESSIVMSTSVVCDMEASLEPRVDETNTVSAVPESESTHVIDDDDTPDLSHVTTSHVIDDTPDYPADLTSSLLTDFDHKTYDTPLDLYIDQYGFMHFARDPRFCVGERECWEAKHIHEEPFVLERSSNVWSKGISHDDISEPYDDDDEYSQYDTILQSKTRHKVNDFGIKKRVRGRKTGVTHAHLKLSQITSTAKPTPITPTRIPSAPIPIRHQRSPSPSPSPSSSPSPSPSPPVSHKRRDNFYNRMRDNRTRYTMAHIHHQQQQHHIDIEKSFHQISTSDDDHDHCHGVACNLSTCAHCRLVARRIKDQRITRDRRYQRDVHVHVDDGWD